MPVFEAFAGKLKFHDGTIVNSVLSITEDTLTVTADGIDVGTWPIKYCRATRGAAGEFELNIDGEQTWFQPVDPYAFGLAAADRFIGSSIADRINVIRNMPLERMIEVNEPQEQPEDVVPDSVDPPTERLTRRPDIRAPALITVGVIAAAVAIAAISGVLSDEPAPERAPVSTTLLVAGDVEPELFTSTPAGFQERWNALVVDSDVRLMIRGDLGPGRFDVALTDRIRLAGDVSGDGTIESLGLSISPTGSASETELALAAMGRAIQLADPSLEGRQRAELLRDLGLGYPDDFSLEGIDDSVVLDGIEYRLRFFDLAEDGEDVLLFEIARHEGGP